jgi:hypothetical protein
MDSVLVNTKSDLSKNFCNTVTYDSSVLPVDQNGF